MGDEAESLEWEKIREDFLSKLDSGVGARCAFCGEKLEAEAPGSLWLTIGSTRGEASQSVFAHAECISGRFHESIPFDAEIFEPDD